jgi:predicted peptidase
MMATMKHLLYRPKGYDEDDGRRPLLVFLHGAGECGDDLDLVKRHGPPGLVEAGRDLPFLIAAPQSRRGGWAVGALDRWLDEVVAGSRVDEDRVYLTGISMGGFGTWAWAAARPDRFAAIAPICGGGDPTWADRLKGLPIRVFHGARDRIVPPECSEVMVAALKRVGADVRYTLYPDAEHDSWTRTYDDPALYEWFLKHRRPTALAR